MYESYFGLTERPFSIAPDPDYLYMSSRHKEAMAHLSYGLSQGGCFIVLTGEVGTGKTTLCRNLLMDLPENVDVALILNANLGSTELLQTVCDELKVKYGDESSQKQLLDHINAHLLKTFAENRHTVLIIDEAQLLKRNVLEQVRMLTNLETTKSKLLQIILIGQPELYDMLSRNDLRQLAQRVTARYHLGPLERSDIEEYVNYRLNVAGCKQPLFSRQALNKLHTLTTGIPRKINVLADHALLATYSQHKSLVDAKTVAKSAKEVFIVTKSRDPKEKPTSSRSSRSSSLSRANASNNSDPIDMPGLQESSILDGSVSVEGGSSAVNKRSKSSRSSSSVPVRKASKSSKSSGSTSISGSSKSSSSSSARKVSKSSRSSGSVSVGESVKSRKSSGSSSVRKATKSSSSSGSVSAGQVSKSSKSRSAAAVSKVGKASGSASVVKSDRPARSSRSSEVSKASRSRTDKSSRSSVDGKSRKVTRSSSSRSRRSASTKEPVKESAKAPIRKPQRSAAQLVSPREPFWSSIVLPSFNFGSSFPWRLVVIASMFLCLLGVVAWWAVGYFASSDDVVVQEPQVPSKQVQSEPVPSKKASLAHEQEAAIENKNNQSESGIKPGKAIISETFLTADDAPVDISGFDVSDQAPVQAVTKVATQAVTGIGDDTSLGKKLEASGDVTGRITALRNLALEWQFELPSKLLNSVCKSVAAEGFKCLEVKEWEKVESFNRPAVVLLKHKEQVHRVIVKSLASAEAAVVIGSSVQVVPVDELKRRWAGSGLIYWRPSLAGAPILKKGDKNKIIKDIRGQLNVVLSSAKLSQLQELTSSKFDDDLSEKVKLLQKSFALKEDGLIGSETYLAMNEVVRADSTPVLRRRVKSVLN